MGIQQLLDSLPIWTFLVLFATISGILTELGYRLGVWWQAKTTYNAEGPTNMITGSILALLAFLLAFTMGMAAERFDTRRNLILEEATTIGTTYLRAGYLPETASTQIRADLKEYIPLRITTGYKSNIAMRLKKSEEIQRDLWATAEQLAREHPESVVLGLFIDSLNDLIDLHETRITAALYARVPETIMFILFFGSILTMAMIGYNTALTGHRSPITSVVLIIILGAVLTLVVDIDRPQDGFLKVNQQPLVDLQKQISHTYQPAKSE